MHTGLDEVGRAGPVGVHQCLSVVAGADGHPPLTAQVEEEEDGGLVVVVVGADVVVVVGARVVDETVVAGRVVVGGANAWSLPPKNGSRAKLTNPRMDWADVSGRQSQRPPSWRSTTT